jgi:hypothetical protein
MESQVLENEGVEELVVVIPELTVEQWGTFQVVSR